MGRISSQDSEIGQNGLQELVGLFGACFFGMCSIGQNSFGSGLEELVRIPSRVDRIISRGTVGLVGT